MTRIERVLASKFLEIAADSFDNHGCNDVDEDTLYGITENQRKALEVGWNDWNSGGDPDEHVPFLHIGDSSWMSYLSHKLKEDS